MSTFTIFQIAGSALTAQSQRMNVAASNLANADSVADPAGQPFRARQVVFRMQPTPDQSQGHVGGVGVAGIVESAAPARMEYEPEHPLADAKGYVRYSNVDPVAESVNMIAASRSYQANVEVINTAKSLMQRTLTLGQ